MQYVIYMTYDCNLRCKYCFNGESHHRSIKWDKLKDIINYIYSREDDDFQIIFFGGEPLLEFAKIKKAIEYISNNYSNKNTLFTINTNGTIYNEEINNFLISNNINILLSIDGNEETHDKYRVFEESKGSYKKIMGNIEVWKKLCSNQQLLVQSTVNQSSVKMLSSNIEHLKNIGLNKIVLNINFDSPWSEENLNIYEKELRKISVLILDSFRSLKKLDICNLTNLVRLGFLKDKKSECGAVSRQLAFNIDGEIFPCSRFVTLGGSGINCIGSIEKGISGADEFLKKKIVNDESCLSCELKRRCIQQCIAINYVRNGKLETPISDICQIEQINIREADRLYIESLETKKVSNNI